MKGIPFWGRTFTAGYMINVSSNGFLSFDGGMSTRTSGTIPDVSAPNGVVAAWWTDLVTSRVYFVTLGSAPSRRFAIEWNGHVYGGTGSLAVEVFLNEADGSIDILTTNYLMLASTTATVGVENLDGTRAVGGCADGTRSVCTNYSGNRIRFAPVP